MQEVRFRFHNVYGVRSDRPAAREAYLRAGGDVCDLLVLAETNCVGGSGEQAERQWSRAWLNGYETLGLGLRTLKVVLRAVWLCLFQSASLKPTHRTPGVLGVFSIQEKALFKQGYGNGVGLASWQPGFVACSAAGMGYQ